jgi:ATP-dependent Lon protease
MRDIINYYTAESGVRNLERELANICRKAAREIVQKNRSFVRLSPANLNKYLGIRRFRHDKADEGDEVGTATGLAWTSVGGETLNIEVSCMKGTGKLELTGQLGDVMKESARAGLSYTRSRADTLDIDPLFGEKTDIHIHIPEGAIPKDGPSAGITMATALISALSNRPIHQDVAMTGEITLRGRVLPVGGLKEKIIAANRAGVKKVILPFDNQKDLEEIPVNVRKRLEFVFAKEMDEVLLHALAHKKPPEDIIGD